MSKRLSATARAVSRLDERIAVLQLARQVLLEDERHTDKPARPRTRKPAAGAELRAEEN